MKSKKLPDTEYEVMNEIWKNEPPVTTKILMTQFDDKWKIQTLISILNRLIKKGFLSSAKSGKERYYTALIKREDYLKFETENFIERYHDNSIVSLFSTLRKNNKLQEKDIEELSKLIKKWGE